MHERVSRRDALAAAGAATSAALGATAGCLSSFPRVVPDPPTSTTATAEFRADMTRHGVYPDASVPADGEIEWTMRDVNTADHTAAKASALPVGNGDVVVPGDTGRLWRVTPTGEVVWETNVTDAQRGFHGTPVLVDGTIYIGAYDGVLYALSAATGEVWWGADLGDAIGSSPTYHDGVVYVAVEFYDPSGAMFGVDAETGDVVWVDHRPTSHPHSTCAIDRDAGRLVVGSNDHNLYCWTYPDLEHAWTFPTDGDIKGPIAVADGSAFFGSWDRTVYRVDLETGEQEWATQLQHLVMSGPSVELETDTVYVGSHDRNLYAFDATTGDERWSHYVAGSAIGCPTVTSDHVLVGSYDGSLHCVRKSDGVGEWLIEATGRLTSTPRVVDGAVYVADRATDAYLEDGSGPSGGLYKISDAT